LLARAQRTTLTAEETAELARFLEALNPGWNGRDASSHFEVDRWRFNIHERVADRPFLKWHDERTCNGTWFAQPNWGKGGDGAYMNLCIRLATA